MNRLEAMSTLLAAIDAGSLSAASRKLGVPLATVSRRVSDLEAVLRTKLLIRTSRRLELTAAGRSYVVACRDILAAVDQAERTAAGEYAAPRGEIVATAPIVFGRLHVLPVVVEFLKAFPDIDVRLMLTDRVTNFIEDHVDVALRIGSLPDSSLIATRLGSVRSVVCASPAYLAEHRPAPVRPSDLATHACITFEGLMSPTVWKFFSGKAEISVPIRTRLAVNTAETAVDAAVAGLGVTRSLELSDRRRAPGTHSQDHPRRFRARAHTRQSSVCRPGIAAAQDARLRRLCEGASTAKTWGAVTGPHLIKLFVLRDLSPARQIRSYI